MKQAADSTGKCPDHILPFYSQRTLASLHRLVRECDSGIAIYMCQDERFATIGTRGVRPLDGTPGLIVHLSVYIHSDDVASASPKVIARQLLHNMAHASITQDQAKALLIDTLETSGLVTAGTPWNDSSWHFF